MSCLREFRAARVSCHREPIVRGHRAGPRACPVRRASPLRRLRPAGRRASLRPTVWRRRSCATRRSPGRDTTRSSGPGGSGRPCVTPPDSSRGSTGSWSTPAGIGSGRRWATDISAEVALATGDHASHAEDRDVIGTAIAALSPDHQYRRRAALLPRPHRRNRRPARYPAWTVSPACTTRSSGCTRRSTRPRPRDRPMTDQAGAAAAPGTRPRSGRPRPSVDLRGRRHPETTPAPLRRPVARFTLLAVAARSSSGCLAAGSGWCG